MSEALSLGFLNLHIVKSQTRQRKHSEDKPPPKPRLPNKSKQREITTINMEGSQPHKGFIVESLASTLLGLTESLPHIRY